MKRYFLAILSLAVLLVSCSDDDNEPSEPVTACFTYDLIHSDLMPIIGNDSVQFTNCSTNATSYLWDFGDGTTSTKENPTHVFGSQGPYYISLKASNSSYSDILKDTVWGWAIAYKPNIYIYPTETISLCVNVNFPKSGKILTSEPEYNDGWCITVEPNGKINETYDFLFYESIQPNIWQTQQGWCVAQSNLPTFFSDILNQYNLSEKEIADFIEYWEPALSTSSYYMVYPQLKGTIDRVITLDFSKNPENIFRLFFAFKGVSNSENIVAPNIIPANREGFNVVEWGGLIL